MRPAFLLVLCILTFIGSGWGFLDNLYGLFEEAHISSSIEMEYSSFEVNESDQAQGAGLMADYLKSVMSTLHATDVHFQKIHVMNLVLNLISLLGAILMFQLRRFGFYLYTAAQLLLPFVIPYFAGFNFYVLTMMLVLGIFSVLFIILYAVNLKYMR